MTTETITTYVAYGILMNDSYSQLDITRTGGVGGFGIGTAFDLYQTIINAGRVYGENDGIYANIGADIVNQRGGMITGAFDGIDGRGSITNYGTIEGSHDAIVSRGDNFVTNGSDGDEQALILGGAVYLKYGAGTVTNFATIAAEVTTTGAGVVTNGDLGDSAATIDEGGGVRLQGGGSVANFGAIQGYGRPGYAGVYLGAGGTVANGAATVRGALIAGYDGIRIVGGPGTVTNSGTIQGFGDTPGAEAIYLGAGGAITSGSVNDAATLIEGYSGVKLAAGGALVNFGTIAGLGDGGGAGVYLTGGSRLTNGAAGHAGALIEGFRGVVVQGAATVTNFGVIAGADGVALAFHFDKDVLVVEAGSSFEGQVLGAGGVLDLASGTGRLTSLLSPGGDVTVAGSMAATTFQDFGTVEVGAGATFTAAGKVTVAAGQTLEAAGVLTLASSKDGVVNAGLIETTGSGTLNLTGALANTGTLEAAGGTITVNGAVSGQGGTVQIDGGTANFTAAFNQKLAFTGASGVLELAKSQTYTAAITGFSTTGGTALDLADIGFVGAGEATFSGGAKSGVLTVTDGTHTARIHLTGDYTGSTFVASSDGHGGTTVVDPTAKPASRALGFAAAMASLGRQAGEGVHAGYAPSPHAPMLLGPRPATA